MQLLRKGDNDQVGTKTWNDHDNGALWWNVVNAFNALVKNLTVTALTVAGNIVMAGFKLTGLGAGTTAGDSIRFEQVVLNPAVQYSDSNATSTTSTTFVDTTLTLNFTPSSASRRVKLTCTAFLSVSGAVDAFGALTFKRSSNLLGTNGFGVFSTQILTDTAFNMASGVYIDSPATASQVTYVVQVRANAGTTTAIQGNSTVTSVLIAEEII